MANLRRNNTITTPLDSYVAPAGSYIVNAYPAGGICKAVNDTPGANTIVHHFYAGHGFAVNDYAMKITGGIPDPSKIAKVDVVDVNGVDVTLHSSTITSSINTVFINLGPDTGGVTPSYIRSDYATRLPIYSTPDTTTVITNASVTCDSGGNYGYWYDSAAIHWELVRNSIGTPVAYFIQNNALLLSTAGTTYKDLAIARWEDSLHIKSNYTSSAVTPVISNAGVITATEAHQLGSTGKTVAILGSESIGENLSVTGTLGVTGVMTAGAANLLGLAGNTTTVRGALSVVQNTALTGTLAVTSTSTLTGGLTTARISGSIRTSAPTTIAFSGTGISTIWPTGTIGSINPTSTDTRLQVTITTPSSGGSLAANPQFKYSFVDGNFASAPYAIVTMNNNVLTLGTGLSYPCASATTVDYIVVTMVSTPSAPVYSKTYIFNILLIG